MVLGLRIFVFGLCMFGGIRLLGLAVSWLKIFFNKLEPDQYRRFKR